MPSATSKTSPSTSCVVSLSLSTHSGQLTQSSSQTPATPSCYVTPSCITMKTSATYPPQGPLQHQVGNLSNASVTPTASSNGQALVGSVFNFAGSSMPLIPCSSRSFTGFSSSPVSAMPHSTMSNSESSAKPFVLKMKTNQICVCQSCRKDYNGSKTVQSPLFRKSICACRNLFTTARIRNAKHFWRLCGIARPELMH